MATKATSDARRPNIEPFFIAATALSVFVGGTIANAATPISDVVVYRDRAQVTRTAQGDCNKGQAVFAGLPSTLDSRSLSATLSAGRGEVVGVKYLEQATGPQHRAKTLQETIRQIDIKRVALGADVGDASAMESKLSSFRQHFKRVWGQQSKSQRPPVRTWDAALDLLRQQALAASRRRRVAEEKRRALDRERALLRAELQRIRRSARRTTYRVTVMLKCKGSPTVHLSYVVPGATWRVSYQARAMGWGGRATLIAQAVIQQGTGEDWRNVRVGVSTANLQRKNTPPKIYPMLVSAHKPYSTRKILTRRFEKRRHLKVSGQRPPASGARGRGVEAGLAMKLVAAKRVSIPADGREIVVTLAKRTVRGALAFETIPKLYPYVYRRLALANPFPFTMLPGPIDLFAGKAFLGRARLKLRAPGEPFALSLGVENQLQVRRYVKKEKLEGASAFGAKKKLRHRYVIEVGNWTKRRQRVTIKENIPVSQVREIKVALSSDSTRPTAHNKEDGIIRWTVTVPPRSKKEIVIGYTVFVPKSYVVTGY